MRPVRITAIGLFARAGAGEIVDFDPRRQLPDRKHAKLMSRSVQLGVAAIREALANRPDWEEIAPERRGLFVGTSPGAGEPDDLMPALAAGVDATGERFDLHVFGERGFPLVPPLWLVRGLTNNVVGFSSAYHEMRGPNATHCEGRASGLVAILDGARAVSEGRADLVVAGGTDSLIAAEAFWPSPVGEGAAFFVLEGGEGPEPRIAGGAVAKAEPEPFAVDRGAAEGAVDLAYRLRGGERRFSIRVVDASGVCASVEVS